MIACADYMRPTDTMKVDVETLFVELATRGSFSAAARALGISGAAASKQISLLEERLGMSLVIRNTRGLRLTEAGQTVFEGYSKILEEKQLLAARLHEIDTSMRGQISAMVPTSFSHQFLSPILKSFIAAHPDISFAITASDNPESLVDGPFDLAVRFGFMTDSSVTARKLADLPIALCCSQSYLEEHGPIENLHDLTNHKLVLPQSFRKSETAKRKALGNANLDIDRIAVLTNDPTFTLECIKNDLGVGALPLMLLDQGLKSHELVHLLPNLQMPVLPLSLVLPGGSSIPLRIRTFVDHLIEQTRNLARP